MERDGRGIPMDQQRRVSRRVAHQQHTTHNDNNDTVVRSVQRSYDKNDDSGLARYSSKRQRLAAAYGGNNNIDFQRLEMRSLLRYKRYFKLPVRVNATKYELIDAVRKHFNKPLLTLPNKDHTGNAVSNALLAPSVSHEHTGSIMPNGQQLTEPDILAAFLHVTHRQIKLKQQQKQKAREQLNG